MASVLEDPALERHFRGHRGAVTCLSFNPNGKQLASGSADKSLMVWNLAPKSRALRFTGHSDVITDLQFCPDGGLVASCSADRTVRLWTPCMKGESTVFRAHYSAVRSVSFSHDALRLVTSSDDRSVKVWSVPRRHLLYSLSQRDHRVHCARFSPDGRLVASCGGDRTVRIWDTSSRLCINVFSCNSPLSSVDFDSSGTCLASSGSDSSVRIWDLRTNKLLQHHHVHSAEVHSVAFHPSNHFLISASADNTVKILDLLEGRLIYTLHGHQGAVFSVAFSRNGAMFASGGADAQVLTWRTNFDRVSYRDMLREHKERSSPEPAPHLSDIPPRSPHQHTPQSYNIQIWESVADTQTPEPHVVEMGQNLCSKLLNERRVGGAKVRVAANGRRAEAKPEAETQRLDVLSGHPSALKTTMQHIVTQLDVLTQTVSVLEERLSMTEDKMKECLWNQAQLLRCLQDPETSAESSGVVLCGGQVVRNPSAEQITGLCHCHSC
uniref:POC1 centriolar protein homolog B n=1 Tax=Knipowitschia caucasica TaxID=637954 RepID=A0AAV2KXB4_KNICA